MTNSTFIIIMIIILIFIMMILKAFPKKKKYKKASIYDVKITPKRLINKQEEIVYYALLKNIVFANKDKLKVFPQVSLGEILDCENNRIFMTKINAKRCDFCITDRNFQPLAIVEYNGKGHYKSDYRKRDEEKRIAVEKAGLSFYTIIETDLKNIDNVIQTEIVVHLKSNI